MFWCRFRGTFRAGKREGRGEWFGADGSHMVAEYKKGKLAKVISTRPGSDAKSAGGASGVDRIVAESESVGAGDGGDREEPVSAVAEDEEVENASAKKAH